MRRFLPNMSAGSTAILLTAAGVLVVGSLVYRVAWTAEAINDRARSIDEVAVSIDEAALAVTALDTTNRHAASILKSATPLDEQLASVASLAESVDRHATSINSSAGTVRGTAATIDATAKDVAESATGINRRAVEIVAVAESIDRGIKQINTNLEATISVVSRVKTDTTNILTQAGTAHQNAACIDASFGKNDGHC